MDGNSFAFVVYMIHACAQKWNMIPSEVYKRLKEVNCIKQYLVPFYDVLHTQSTEYVVHDIEEYLRVRGKSI